MSIEEEIRVYVTANLLKSRGGPEVADDTALIQTGRIDSLGLLKLIGFIDRRFHVNLMDDATPEEFESISQLAQAVRRRREARP